MAGSVNKVIIVGNLGADPEVRNLPSGGKVVNLSIATSESWKDKNTGERREKTEWHRVVIFSEGLANVAEKYLQKGSKVYIEGQLQTRKWQDQSGTDKYSTEVVLQGFNSNLTLLDSRNDGDNSTGGQRQQSNNDRGGNDRGNNGGGGRQQNNNSGNGQNNNGGGGGFGGGGFDDDIPFAPQVD